MESIRKLAERLVDDCMNNNIPKRTKSQMIQHFENSITWAMDDAFKVTNNIRNTSLNKMDAAQRYIELENKHGIPKTHLIIDND
jgi:hypothetical protein